MASSTRTALLHETETLMRTRGYSAFSYADLAEKLNIHKASIHHHFPTKESLGLALIEAYVARFSDCLSQIEGADVNSIAKLRSYARLFAGSSEECQLPLCGALAAESASLPESMKQKTSEFFDLHLEWLEKIVTEGVAERSLRASVEPKEAAFLILSVLEGASFVGWVRRELVSIARPFEAVLAGICSTY